MHRTNKSKTFRQRPKPNQKVTIQSISLACEDFFRSRGMLNREPFTRWRSRSAVRQDEDELA